MIRYLSVSLFAVTILIAVLVISASADEMSSTNYRITTTVTSGGGGSMGSANFQTSSTIGQPSPLMEQGIAPYSDNFSLLPGFWYTVAFSDDSPTPDIKANGSDGPVTIPALDTLIVTVALKAGDLSSINCDWWCVAQTPWGWYYYEDLTDMWLKGFNVTYRGPCADLDTFEVLNTTLPDGDYTFYFGVDDNMNGTFDGNSYYDSVDVTITQ